jgi:hypothetical protein
MSALADIAAALAAGKSPSIALPSAPKQTVRVPAKAPSNPPDAVAAQADRIAAQLKRNGRDATEAPRIAVGLFKVHTKYHGDPEAPSKGCDYCPPPPWEGKPNEQYWNEWLAAHPDGEDW